MEIEKQRGISVTSSVLQFDYDGFRINILDTPGHQDFSEDTYRTLMAADSAVMLIDVAKGWRIRRGNYFTYANNAASPFLTFVNKLDRFGKSPFELMEEIEKCFGNPAYPMNWPVGVDGAYAGVYNRSLARSNCLRKKALMGNGNSRPSGAVYKIRRFVNIWGKRCHQALCDDIELLDMAGDQFDMEQVTAGQLTPMFFGSAMTNFGVQPFLEEFLAWRRRRLPA